MWFSSLVNGTKSICGFMEGCGCICGRWMGGICGKEVWKRRKELENFVVRRRGDDKRDK